jgi:hypothetical protein
MRSPFQTEAIERRGEIGDGISLLRPALARSPVDTDLRRRRISPRVRDNLCINATSAGFCGAPWFAPSDFDAIIVGSSVRAHRTGVWSRKT